MMLSLLARLCLRRGPLPLSLIITQSSVPARFISSRNYNPKQTVSFMDRFWRFMRRVDYKYPRLFFIIGCLAGSSSIFIILFYNIYWRFMLTPAEYELRQQYRSDLVYKRATTGDGLVVPFQPKDDTYLEYQKNIANLKKTLEEDFMEEFEYDGGKYV